MPINTIIFDLGNVLVYWSPMYVYENYFDTKKNENTFLRISVLRTGMNSKMKDDQ